MTKKISTANNDLFPDPAAERAAAARSRFRNTRARSGNPQLKGKAKMNFVKAAQVLGPGLNSPPFPGAVPSPQTYTKPTRSNPLRPQQIGQLHPEPMSGAPHSTRITAQPRSPNADILGSIDNRRDISTLSIEEIQKRLRRYKRGY
jgi:hypothetical protein